MTKLLAAVAAVLVMNVSPVASGARADTPVIVVTTTADGGGQTGASGCHKAGSPMTIRCAILQADAVAPASIDFDIPPVDPGCGPVREANVRVTACVIQPLADLPPLAGVTLDGYSQPDGSPNTLPLDSGDDAHVVIQIDGGRDESRPSSGLTLLSGSTVSGLSLTGFDTGVASDVGPNAAAQVAGSFVGLAPDGSTIHANGVGVSTRAAAVNGTSYALIGGPNPGDRDVISGNRGDGVLSVGVTQIRWSDCVGETRVENDYVGLSRSGERARPNETGVDLSGCEAHTVRDSVVSGNRDYGLVASALTPDLGLVTHNLIGTDARAEKALGNKIGVSSLSDTISGNVISGNTNDGVQFISYHGDFGEGAPTVVDNTIGTGLTASAAIPNRDGIEVTAGSDVGRIDRNTIEFNQSAGIRFDTAGSVHMSANEIRRNAGPAVDLGDPVCDDVQVIVACPVITRWRSDLAAGHACSHCVVEVFRADSGPGDEHHGGVAALLARTRADRYGGWVAPLKPGQFDPSIQSLTATATLPISSGAPPDLSSPTSAFALDEPDHPAVVTTADDTECPDGAGPISLRCAIMRINSLGGGGSISFAIAGPRQAPIREIQPLTPLPAVSAGSTFISGDSQPGVSPGSVGGTRRGIAHQSIVLDGSEAGPNANGLTLTGQGDDIDGVSIEGFSADGIAATGDGANGLSLQGVELSENGGDGVRVDGSGGPSGPVGIGGPKPSDQNREAANGGWGIDVDTSENSSPSRISNNLVGATAKGSSGANRAGGVRLVGGSGDVNGNVISGNDGTGLRIDGGSWSVETNVIGFDPRGVDPLGNRSDGIRVEGALLLSSRNLVGWNGGDGVSIRAGAQAFFSGGDRVGVYPGGEFPAPNQGDGIDIRDSKADIDHGQGWTIVADNKGAGVRVTRPEPYGVVIAGIVRNNTAGEILLSAQRHPGCSAARQVVTTFVPCPVITKVSRGDVKGISCPHCTVDIYFTNGIVGIQGGSTGSVAEVQADANGRWESDGVISPGLDTRVTATATWGDETSEFAANIYAGRQR